jgi:putative serine protease PepD
MANPTNDPNGTTPVRDSETDTRPGTAAPGTWPAAGRDDPAADWGARTTSSWPPSQTTPSWAPHPSGPDGWDRARPRRNPFRTLAAVLAAALLVLSGVVATLLVDRRDATGAGIPAASQAAPLAAGEEPAAAVARILGPSVVQIETPQGLGSGVVYDKNGYILTAAHVVQGADTVTIRLADGSALRGKVLGTDGGNDVAVVKVDRGGLKPATLALKVNLQVGQAAVAIGSPFGLQQTVTAGVVSAKNRSLQTQDGGALEVIQTDAPINPGNSGGALADRAGRVIGINDSIRSESGGNEGVGFAIPIDTAANSAARIVKGEKIQSGYLGVGLSSAAPALGQAGALIGQVEPGSPAQQAGIRVGDLVTEFNGRAIQSSDDLAAQVRLVTPGEKVSVKLVRSGKEQAVTATLTNRPSS